MVRVADLDARLGVLLAWLKQHEGGTDLEQAAVASALHDPAARSSAFAVLALSDPRMTEAVVGNVVSLAASDRWALEARWLIGRLSWQRSRRLVPPHVEALLDDADDHDYRRYAELLEYLGLYGALDDLCTRADESVDSGIREVAQEFRH